MKYKCEPTKRDFPRVMVVIPTYRAEGTIAEVISGLPDWIAGIVVIDDACPDASAAVVSELDDPRIHLVRHEVNKGVGAATVSGYRLALDLGADIVVKMDADGQMDARDLSALLTPIVREEADATKGNRFTSRKKLASMPFHRKLGNAALAFMSKWSSGYWGIFDPCNGYVAVSRPALLAMELDELHPRFFFESSLLVTLALSEAVVRDVPMEAVYKGEHSSLSAVNSILRFPVLHLRYGLRRWMKQYFLLDFSIASIYLLVGLPLTAVGVVDGAFSWLRAIRTEVATPTGTIVLVAVMIIVGLQLVLQAMAFDMARTPSSPLQRLEEVDFNKWRTEEQA